MLCPRCYGKVNKNSNRCDYCGFCLNDLDGASNKLAKKIKRTIYRDDILYSSKLPADVSKKKLLLFCIFLGLFGAHDFYVGKTWNGLFLCLSSSIISILSLILSITGSITNNIIQVMFEYMTVPQGFAVLIWIIDIFKIIFEKFRVPVYKESFSKK